MTFIHKTGVLLTCLLITAGVCAQEQKVDPGVKELSGISIIGNKEVPKSLYIVPWQNSEVGVATSLNAGMMENEEGRDALDREVFMRELEYYDLSRTE